MASHNSDGTPILQAANVKRIAHTGSKLIVNNTKLDDVIGRLEDTDYRPSENGTA